MESGVTEQFDYRAAFDRNYGLLTEDEMERVRSVRIGLGGVGGCGSNDLLALTRMGFERFVIADPDTFEVANLNRQAGATLPTIGHRKVDVMTQMVLDINPGARVTAITDGIDEKTIDDFVGLTDVGINAIDFFRADLYPAFHDSYHARGKYSIVGASPFAFGAAMTVVGPGSPSFSEFFGINDGESAEQILRKFVAGMTPQSYAAEYLQAGVNEIRSPLRETRISSSAAALQLCTALTVAEILFIVTGRRAPTLAPRVLQLDLQVQQFTAGAAAVKTD
jgi:molybdopterin/thiamine biosynthesis adenylyltransferase